MIPFCGAFIRIAGWDIKKSMIYIVIGCILKYGVIALMIDFFYSYYQGPDAQTYTLIFIFAVIGISFIASMLWKRKKGIKEGV